MIKIGPEDIGKQVFVSSVRKTGIVTSFTADYVSVRSPNDRMSQRYKREDCIYLRSALRH
jgi:hypothetical protein